MELIGYREEGKRVLLANVGKYSPTSIDNYVANGGFEALKKVLKEMSPTDLINTVKESGLRGRGGAGFPTGLKWELTAKEDSDVKYVIANADEGEFGTFKDRMIMEGDPYLLIEGMVLAGYAVGATEGYIYLRAEYPHLWHVLGEALEKARERGYLGKKIQGSDFSFDIKLFRGAGAYVCGEETALLESLEGKRGHPRRKPPYPAQHGLWGKPTVVNNVETLSYVPLIIKNGIEWFRSMGTEKSPGTKIFTVIGRVKHPGGYEVEMGTPLSTLLFDYACADRNEFKGALVGGAAGVVVDESFLDVKLDFESLEERGALLGSGAILVFNKDDCVVDILHSVLQFFKHESCGKCAPCRLGTQALFEIIEEIRYGEATGEDIDKMVEIAETMKDAAYCPLGQFVVLPVKSAIERFRGEIERHLDPQFACKKCWR